jgi:hypothetical protein
MSMIYWERRSKTHQRFVRALRYVGDTWPRLSGLVRNIYATKNPPLGWHSKKASIRGCAKIRRNKLERDVWVRKVEGRPAEQYVRTLVHEFYHLFQTRNMSGRQVLNRHHLSGNSRDKYEGAARRMGELAVKRFRRT